MEEKIRAAVFIDLNNVEESISASATGICVSSEVITESGQIFVCPTS